MSSRPPEEQPPEEQALRLLALVRQRVWAPVPERIAETFLAVPRHRFVPPDALTLAYQDVPVPLVSSAASDRPVATISQPTLVLDMLHLADVQPGHRVLEIGTASGWNAAMLGRLVGPGGRVTTVEILPELARNAARHLAQVGATNVRVVEADGGEGWPEDGPYDRVLYTASSPDLPGAVRKQVADGGRVLLVLAITSDMDCLVVFDREGEAFRSKEVRFCRFVPLTGSHGQVQELPTGEELLRSLGEPSLVAVRPHWLGADHPRDLPWSTMGLRLFLALTVPGFRTVRSGFAVVERGTALLCLASAHGTLHVHGGHAALRRFERALLRWAREGMPSASAWTVSIGTSARTGYALRRKETLFRWELSSA